MFGVNEAVQPLEGQERLCPVSTTEHQIATDLGRPGRFRGGCGVRKGGTLTGVRNTVIPIAAIARVPSLGHQGKPTIYPHGVWLTPAGGEARYMGAVFSNVSVRPGDHFTALSAGGGGLGDPLERDPEALLEDVIDEYVSVERTRKDYGVIIREIDRGLDHFEIDAEVTTAERRSIRAKRCGWLSEDPEEIASWFRGRELPVHDLVRQYALILDWGTGEFLPKTTKISREMMRRAPFENSCL